MQRAYRPLLGQIGLTYTQYLVMLVLWQDGERAITEIAARLALPAHAIGPVVDRLQRSGKVGCERRPGDRRVRVVRLTAAGAELESAASVAQRQVVCQTRLSDPQLRGLRQELRRLVEAMAVDDELDGRPIAAAGHEHSAQPHISDRGSATP